MNTMDDIKITTRFEQTLGFLHTNRVKSSEITRNCA